jgi:hypothetical protein
MIWDLSGTFARNGRSRRRTFVPTCERLEERDVPAKVTSVPFATDFAQAASNRNMIQGFIQQGQETTAAAKATAKADTVVENRLLADVKKMKATATSALAKQLAPFQAQLNATFAADNQMMQAFAMQYFTAIGSGNVALAQMDLQIIMALYSNEVAAVNLYVVQIQPAANSFNATMSFLNQVQSDANDAITLNGFITSGKPF